MSLTEQTPRTDVILSTATDVIPFTYQFDADTELLVVSDGRGTLILTTDYTVTGAGTDIGGDVTMVTGVIGEKITVLRNTPLSQTLVLRVNGRFFVTDIGESLDKLTKIVQEVDEELARCLKTSVSDGTALDLPDAAERLGKLIRFDENGDLQVTTELGDWEGEWVTATAYDQFDMFRVSATASVYHALVAHTSTNIAADLVAERIAVLIDGSAILDAVALAEAAAANAAASELASSFYEADAQGAATAASQSAVNAVAAEENAEDWATAPEDTLVPAAAGGNGVDDFSSLHHAAKADQSATDSANSATDSANSAAAAAAVPAGGLNPKAFAGGVSHISGVGSLWREPIPSYLAVGGTFFFSLRLMIQEHPSAVTNIVGFDEASGDRFGLQLDASGRISVGERVGGVSQGSKFSSPLLEKTWYHVLGGLVNGSPKLYLNGVAQGSAATYTMVGANVGDLYFNEAPVDSSAVEASFAEYAALNTEPTATQAQEIYEQGISGWLAANPSYKWGKPVEEITINNAINSTDAAKQFASISGASTTGVTATYDDGNTTNVVGWELDVPFVTGGLYRVSGNIQSNGGTPIDILAANNAAFNQFFGWTANVPDGDFNLITTAANTSLFIAFRSDSPAASGDLVVSNLKLEKVGCLTSLPMDEGVGFQLRDQSSNHFDALLSETGTTHLIPKTEGFIRDFNVDAYNAAAGAAELVSSSRDILPAGATITSAHVHNRSASLIGNLLLAVEHSDRTTRVEIGENKSSIQADTSIVIATAEQRQDPLDRNVALSAPTETGATDVDVRVDYKLIG